MARNEHRDTAGRTLVGFAVVVALVAVATGQDWWEKMDLELILLPTAVEDQDYYAGLGENDFEAPNLVFWGAPDGALRLSPTPLMLRDFRMRKLVDRRTGVFTRDADDKVFVYRYEKDDFDAGSGIPARYFLKVSDNQYLEFGDGRGTDPAGGP
ncbi:hypothetical protein BH23VER1_BH23VER1_15950 [soil metagenome]